MTSVYLGTANALGLPIGGSNTFGEPPAAAPPTSPENVDDPTMPRETERADMTPHRPSPIAALVGVAVLATGIVVGLFGVDRLGHDPVVWGAAAAVFVALILVAIPTRDAGIAPTEPLDR